MALAMAASLAGTGVAAAQSTSSQNCVYVKLNLDNPAPGTQIPPGPYSILGTAQDIRATQGNGISQVQVFLGPRGSGGQLVATGAFANPQSPQFTAIAGMPSTGLGPNTIQAIATSAVDGHQYEVDVPFTLANPALPGTSGGQETTLPPLCAAGAQSAPSSSSAPSTPAPSTSGSTTSGGTATSSAGPELHVIAPQSGAAIFAGPFSLNGTAWDPAASSGSGIDQVQVFLDDRNAGGQFLGNANLNSGGTNGWQATVGLPTNNTGPHSFYIYATSSVTGKTSVATVPITISIS
jgi:hypothetical protein